VESRVIGQAIIPISRVLPSLTRPPTDSPSYNRQRPEVSVCEWIELFPLPKDQCRFVHVPAEMALDVRGMERPRARLGMLQVCSPASRCAHP